MADEVPPDAPPAETADNAPVRDRVESKTWKTRMEAFVELAKVRVGPQLGCRMAWDSAVARFPDFNARPLC